MKMEIDIAYLQLISKNLKNSYFKNSGKLVYNQGWAWLVVFEAMNKHNYAIIKYYNGKYEVVEI